MAALGTGLGMIGAGRAINMALTLADMEARTQKEANTAAKNAI